MWFTFLADLFVKLLGFVFSGSVDTSTVRTPGLPVSSVQKDNVMQNLSTLAPKLLVMVSVLALLFSLQGCVSAFGGAKVEYKIVMVEPADVLEVADDKPLDVLVKVKNSETGKEEMVVAKRNMAGTVAMPKSVYNAMREAALSAKGTMPLDIKKP
jgi:hypothetical protein